MHGTVGILILFCSRVHIVFAITYICECVRLALQPVITGMLDLKVVRIDRLDAVLHFFGCIICSFLHIAVVSYPVLDRRTRIAIMDDNGLLARPCIPFRSQRRVPAHALIAFPLFLICNLFRQINQPRAIPPIGIALVRGDCRYIKAPVNTGRIGLSGHQNDVQFGLFNRDRVFGSASGEGCTADALRVKLAVNDFQHSIIGSNRHIGSIVRIIIILHCDDCRSSRVPTFGQNDRRQKREYHAETQKQGNYSLLQFMFLHN